MHTPKVLVIDNFDSFTFNLVEEFRCLNCQVAVWRNDISAQQALELSTEMFADLIVLSPGPGRPAEAGCCIELIQLLADKLPILGICLGHQAIIEAFGGTIGPANEIVHGKASFLHHQQDLIFNGLPSPMSVARYHSLVAHSIPPVLEVIAHCDNLPMALKHRQYPIIGLQFHPESLLTPEGSRLIKNILKWSSGIGGH